MFLYKYVIIAACHNFELISDMAVISVSAQVNPDMAGSTYEGNQGDY